MSMSLPQTVSRGRLSLHSPYLARLSSSLHHHLLDFPPPLHLALVVPLESSFFLPYVGMRKQTPCPMPRKLLESPPGIEEVPGRIG